jgi:hypothetical protein
MPGNGKWSVHRVRRLITDGARSPKTHPKRLVSLVLSRFFDTSSFNPKLAKDPKQPWVFSNGDPTGRCRRSMDAVDSRPAAGYGFHGDVINGWETTTLKQAISQCTHKDGTVEFCTPFSLQSTTQDSAPYAPLCRRTPTVNEVVTGLLPKLPGCNPVTPGEFAMPSTRFRAEAPQVPATPYRPPTAPSRASSLSPSSTPAPFHPSASKRRRTSLSSCPRSRSTSTRAAIPARPSASASFLDTLLMFSRSPALSTKLSIAGQMTVQKCLAACEKKKLAFCTSDGLSHIQLTRGQAASKAPPASAPSPPPRARRRRLESATRSARAPSTTVADPRARAFTPDPSSICAGSCMDTSDFRLSSTALE